MKPIPTLGTVLFALFLFMAVLTETASAEEALWLISGAEVTTLTSVEMIGEVLAEDTKSSVGKVAIKECSGIFDGSIGPKGEGEVTEVLTLAGVSVSASKLGKLTGGLVCKGETVCEGTDAEAWPSTLPFKTELELMANGEILEVLLSIGFTIKCLVLGISVEDECSTTAAGMTMENMAEGVLGIFKGEEPDTCQEGGAASGIVEGSAVTLTLTGLEVTVDSP